MSKPSAAPKSIASQTKRTRKPRRSGVGRPPTIERTRGQLAELVDGAAAQLRAAWDLLVKRRHLAPELGLRGSRAMDLAVLAHDADELARLLRNGGGEQ